MANGWDVNIPVAVEAYDLVATDPIDNKMKKIQVKTMKVRRDMNGRLVVKGAKANGKPYSRDEAEYIACIYGTHLFLVDNTEQTEYTAANVGEAKARWRTLRLSGDEEVVIPEVIAHDITSG